MLQRVNIANAFISQQYIINCFLFLLSKLHVDLLSSEINRSVTKRKGCLQKHQMIEKGKSFLNIKLNAISERTMSNEGQL